ncbi:hypothetical protein [Oceanobacillus saliphilus]
MKKKARFRLAILLFLIAIYLILVG